MKNEEMIVLGLAALAVWFIVKGKKSSASVGGIGATKVAPDYMGWQYFSNGVTMGPDGIMYQYGNPI